jgi:hypothetical protein
MMRGEAFPITSDVKWIRSQMHSVRKNLPDSRQSELAHIRYT